MVAMFGDANMDGSVNFSDLSTLLAHYNQSGDWSQGDCTNDGLVNFADLSVLMANYNMTAGGAPLDGVGVVPEPSTLALLAAGMLAALFVGVARRQLLR
jgi:hypothetical protein